MLRAIVFQNMFYLGSLHTLITARGTRMIIAPAKSRHRTFRDDVNGISHKTSFTAEPSFGKVCSGSCFFAEKTQPGKAWGEGTGAKSFKAYRCFFLIRLALFLAIRTLQPDWMVVAAWIKKSTERESEKGMYIKSVYVLHRVKLGPAALSTAETGLLLASNCEH